ncbi:MAG: hypothetical protein EA370_12285 [Wenzhouxiangella sp.]|nr:MAG: hypothetical protein EA370_12285 [Wenzhouxiangella sp.]
MLLPRVLCVCSANVCRSPVAEHILRDRLQRAGVKGVVVESAGSLGMAPLSPPRECLALLAERGLDLSGHQPRAVDAAMMARAELVLCLAREHVDRLRSKFPEAASKIHLLGEMSGQPRDVDDPYGRSFDHYRRMVDEVSDLIDAGLEEIIRRCVAEEDRQ